LFFTRSTLSWGSLNLAIVQLEGGRSAITKNQAQT
jgi:hypothetical protein